MALLATDIEVRPDGNDLNGGGFTIGAAGTDHPASNTVLHDLSDWYTMDNGVTLKSDNEFFTPQASAVGNLFQLASGTNAVAGWYRITSYDGGSGNSYTLDRACTNGSSDLADGVGRVGGALATPGQAANLMNSVNTAVAGHRVHQKEGTYNNTGTTVNVAGGPIDFASGVHAMYNKVLYWEGYKTTRGDMDGTITIDANGNAPASGYMWRMGGNSSGAHHVVNIALDADSQASIDGFFVSSAAPYNFANLCSVSAADYGFDGVATLGSIATSCARGFRYGNHARSVAMSCTAEGFNIILAALHCIAANCPRGFYAPAVTVNSCVAYNCSTSGYENSQPLRGWQLSDSIAYSCGYSFLGMEYSVLINCASGNPTSGRYDTGGDPIADINPITLSNTVGDVFVNAAGGDFRLVNTAGGGALLWAQGLGVIGQTDNNRDIGAVQHADPAGGGGIFMPAARQIGV